MARLALAGTARLASRRPASHRLLRTVLALALASLAAAACGERPRPVVEVAVDGGSDGVVLMAAHRIAVAPGAMLRIVHASAPERGSEAPATHAFVAGEPEAVPDLFVPGGGGARPNPAVWGACRGGETDPTLSACPVAPAEAPGSWDGRSYWSTGALLPGEHAEIPLADELPEAATLTCAIHPELRIEVAVADEPTGPAAADGDAVEARVAEARATAASMPAPPGTVLAGVEVPGAMVQRFFPARIEIRAGEPVTWRPGGSAPIDVVFGEEGLSLAHTEPVDAVAQAPMGGWDGEGTVRSGYLAARDEAWAGDRFTLVLSTPGTYRYTTRFADGAVGEVIVRP